MRAVHGEGNVGLGQARFHPDQIVVRAVAGGSMHKARTCFIGDVIAFEQGDGESPIIGIPLRKRMCAYPAAGVDDHYALRF